VIQTLSELAENAKLGKTREAAKGGEQGQRGTESEGKANAARIKLGLEVKSEQKGGPKGCTLR